MKFKFIGVVLALVLVLACGFTAQGEQMPFAENAPVTQPEISESEILIARFENMLNHNYVYNDDFDSSTVMIDNAVLALIDQSNDDGFIKSDIVEGFVYNMYGISLLEYEENPDFPALDGYVFVIPRGFDTINHKVVSAEQDGSFTHVDSIMTLTSHEGFTYEYNCRTIFEEKDTSFGYIIVSSIYY